MEEVGDLQGAAHDAVRSPGCQPTVVRTPFCEGMGLSPVLRPTKAHAATKAVLDGALEGGVEDALRAVGVDGADERHDQDIGVDRAACGWTRRAPGPAL